MKNHTRNYFVKSIFFFVALLMFGCSKDAAVTPAAAELSILGKWKMLVTRITENGKTTFEYIGKSSDYVEITNNDFIRNSDGSTFAAQYKVVEKNKKITLIGSSSSGDELVEIRNLTSTSMTIYQESVRNNITYVNYMDLKR